MITVGEIALIDKQMLYKLLKSYINGKSDSNV